jgi:hypothetical protein
MNSELKKKISSDFGLTKMDSEEQERIIEKIGNLLFESVIERSLNLMNEQTTKDFDEVITNAGEDYEKVIRFLNENVPGFNNLVIDEMKRLKKATTGIFS